MIVARWALASCTVFVACASGGARMSGSANAASAIPDSASPPAAESLVATMVATNASGNRITGRIRLVPSDRPGELIAEIDLRGGAYQNKYAWTVRSGQCGERGQELGTSLAYRHIETRGDGMAQMKTPVRVSIPSGATYHIAIFAGATNSGSVVSCGVLSPQK